jgi:hypothetical protein
MGHDEVAVALKDRIQVSIVSGQLLSPPTAQPNTISIGSRPKMRRSVASHLEQPKKRLQPWPPVYHCNGDGCANALVSNICVERAVATNQRMDSSMLRIFLLIQLSVYHGKAYLGPMVNPTNLQYILPHRDAPYHDPTEHSSPNASLGLLVGCSTS